MSERHWNSSLQAYGYVTLTGSEPIQVKPGENIRFNQHGSLENIRFSQSSGALTVLESGDYKIEYTLLIGGPASTSVYGIFFEHSLVDKNLTNYGITRQVDNAILTIVGQAIFHIHKNSKIRLKNIGPTTDTLLPVLNGTKINAASLSIVKLS